MASRFRRHAERAAFHWAGTQRGVTHKAHGQSTAHEEEVQRRARAPSRGPLTRGRQLRTRERKPARAARQLDRHAAQRETQTAVLPRRRRCAASQPRGRWASVSTTPILPGSERRLRCSRSLGTAMSEINANHEEELLKYLRFARFKRDFSIREVQGSYNDLKDSRYGCRFVRARGRNRPRLRLARAACRPARARSCAPRAATLTGDPRVLPFLLHTRMPLRRRRPALGLEQMRARPGCSMTSTRWTTWRIPATAC